MNENDKPEFGKNSRLQDLFKLLQDAMKEQNNQDKTTDFDSYIQQFENNMSHTIYPFMELEGKDPDKIEKFTEDGLSYEVKYWFIPGGGQFKSVDIHGVEDNDNPLSMEENISKIMQSNMGVNVMNVDVNRAEKSKSLEQLLNEAVAKEEYMVAAEIRDEIKSRNDAMESKIIEINLALEMGDIDKSEILLDELRRLKK